MIDLSSIYSLCSLEICTWSIITLQDAVSPIIEELTFFHDFAIIIIIIITTLVGLNIVFICLYKLTNLHLLQHQTIEIIWTIFPVFILIGIARPSLKALYILDDPFSPNLTIKAVGHQWYWSYEYSDFPDLSFESYILPNRDLRISDSRLLETDNSLVIPIFTQTRIIITAADVIHAWTIPALGIKADAVPGRLNQLIFSAKRPGIFYGQCSEICGANHSFIPIKIEIIPIKNFINWVNSLYIWWLKISVSLLNLI